MADRRCPCRGPLTERELFTGYRVDYRGDGDERLSRPRPPIPSDERPSITARLELISRRR